MVRRSPPSSRWSTAVRSSIARSFRRPSAERANLRTKSSWIVLPPSSPSSTASSRKPLQRDPRITLQLRLSPRPERIELRPSRRPDRGQDPTGRSQPPPGWVTFQPAQAGTSTRAAPTRPAGVINRVIRPRLRCHGSGRWHSDALARWERVGGTQRDRHRTPPFVLGEVAVPTHAFNGKHASVIWVDIRGSRRAWRTSAFCYERSSGCRCRVDAGGSRPRPNASVGLSRSARSLPQPSAAPAHERLGDDPAVRRRDGPDRAEDKRSVAEAKARRDHHPKMKGVVGLLDRWRVLLSGSGRRCEARVCRDRGSSAPDGTAARRWDRVAATRSRREPCPCWAAGR